MRPQDEDRVPHQRLDELSQQAARNLHSARLKPYRPSHENVLMGFLVVTRNFTPPRAPEDVRNFSDGVDQWRNYAKQQYELANVDDKDATLPPSSVGNWRRVGRLIFSELTHPPDLNTMSRDEQSEIVLAEALINQDPRIHFPDLKASQILWGRGFSMTILSQTVSE